MTVMNGMIGKYQGQHRDNNKCQSHALCTQGPEALAWHSVRSQLNLQSKSDIRE